jgi:hypothetical protein
MNKCYYQTILLAVAALRRLLLSYSSVQKSIDLLIQRASSCDFDASVAVQLFYKGSVYRIPISLVNVVVWLYLTLSYVMSVFFLSLTMVSIVGCSFQVIFYQHQLSLF